MFANERRNYIKNLLLQNKRLDVLRVSSQLGVSEVTIRKDLDFLEKNGFLIRTHGGAVLKENPVASPAEEPPSSHIQAITRTLAKLIQDNDQIYLGSDPICTVLASQLLSKQNLTVITNNVTASLKFAGHSNIRIILPGGTLYQEQNYCILKGRETQNFLSEIRYDKAVISADAVRLNTGFYLRDAEVCDIYRTVLAQSDQKILAVNGECFNKNAFYHLASLNDFDIVVSDEQMPEEFLSSFSNSSVKVFTTYDFNDV